MGEGGWGAVGAVQRNFNKVGLFKKHNFLSSSMTSLLRWVKKIIAVPQNWRVKEITQQQKQSHIKEVSRVIFISTGKKTENRQIRITLSQFKAETQQ